MWEKTLSCWGQTSHAAIPGQQPCCMCSSRQPGMSKTCLAHHQLYTHKVNHNDCGSVTSELRITSLPQTCPASKGNKTRLASTHVQCYLLTGWNNIPGQFTCTYWNYNCGDIHVRVHTCMINRTLVIVPYTLFVYFTSTEMRTPHWSGHFLLSNVSPDYIHALLQHAVRSWHCCTWMQWMIGCL